MARDWNMKKILLLGLSTLIFSKSIYADASMILPGDKAREAAELLLKKEAVKLYCKPCGDLKATTEYINKVELKQSDFKDYKHNNYMTLYINDKPVNVHSVYFQKRGIFGKKWINLGEEIGHKTREDIDKKLKNKR